MFARTLRPLRKILSRSIGTKVAQFANSGNSTKYFGAAAVAAGVVTMFGIGHPYSTPAALAQDRPAFRDLYPPIEPYHTADIKVSDIHTVHYEVYGNPNGKPVLVVHGGPGAGTSPKVSSSLSNIFYFLHLVADGSIL
jgi:hypothetical protein